jgi:hypothetical protein
MDEIRDIRKPDSLSRFLDSHVVRTNPFGRNVSGEKSYRRAERLVAALHMLTSHIPENEPIRQSIRTNAIKLLSDVLELRDEMRIPNSNKIRVAQSTIRKLISLVRMLAASSLISIQNADIAVEAIDELGNLLNLSQRTSLSESTILSREYLLSGSLTAEKRTSLLIKDKLSHTDFKKDTNISDNMDGNSVKDSKKDMGIHISSRTNDAISIRSREILTVLRSGGEMGIRDISSNLPEYSEKMIQRELAALIRARSVKKTGLKRWSRYSIADNG